MEAQANADDIVDLIRADHNNVRALFEEFDAASGDRRNELWQMIVRLLAVHETAEEEIVHPLVRRFVDGGDDIVDARLAEEDAAKKTLAELEQLGPDAVEFPERFGAFARDVLAHADREEREELPALRESVDADDLRRITSVYEAAKAVAPTHPHKLAPESATGDVVVGSVAALIDRVRDAIRDARSEKNH